MKYKQQISDKIDAVIQKIDIVTRGMQSNTMTANEVFTQLEITKRILESMNELVELE